VIFAFLSQFQVEPVNALVSLATFVFALITALTFHEFSHALVATLSGDPTARRMGRLSLHPIAHLDPAGTAMILLAGFGWAKPVPVNPANLRTGERPGMAAVAFAGPLSNVLLATILSIPIHAGLVTSAFLGFTVFHGSLDDIPGYISSVIFWNLLIAAFNLIPVAPLDGFRVALGILPQDMATSFARFERHGPAILMGVILFDIMLPGPGILASVISPILNLLSLVVLGRQLL
jgi:Zn-dependent protease